MKVALWCDAKPLLTAAYGELKISGLRHSPLEGDVEVGAAADSPARNFGKAIRATIACKKEVDEPSAWPNPRERLSRIRPRGRG